MKEEDIKLFPHNEKAYQNLVTSLDEYPLAFIEHATGTGKTPLILKYLYVMMRMSRILFVSLHDEMFDPLFGKQMKTLGMKREDFKKFETLIYHNLIKQDPRKLIEEYDCFVFDEAHHCGAPKWSKIVEGIKEEVLKRKDKKMIGLTATGIRYLDNYMDVCEKFFDGHLASRLGVAEAILKALLPAPLYINSIVSCKEKYNRIMNKLKKLPRTDEISKVMEKMNEIGKNINDNSSIPDLLKKYDVKPGEKYIVFCKDIKDLKNKMQEAQDWFKDIGEVKMFEAHSYQKKEKNREQISEFEQKRDEVSLMFAVDIFNEGFHIDDLDGILMFRKTKSPIVYLQQIGRALSFSVRKKQIKIFDFVDNISDNDVIRELYKELVSEAKRLVDVEPENKELFESIIRRFEIVDYTSSTSETLDEINDYLDENFTFRNSITRAIGLLQQYRDEYPNNDIQRDIKYGKLDLDYLRAYNHIITMDKYLTLSNIEFLNNLNIDFNGAIITDIGLRRELLNGHNCFNDVEASIYNKFRSEYIEFTNINNRRPEKGHSKNEDALYEQYRHYLNKLNKKELMNLFNKFNFKLTVEEIILTGNYPNKDDLYAYFRMMAKRIADGIGFDRVELKVLRKLKSLIPMEFFQLKDYLDHKKDVNTLIDETIEILVRNEKLKKQAKENGYIAIINNREVIRANNNLQKYANHVNNEQFKKLLEYKITLPRAIDMSWEERIERLGNYTSFYEKEADAEANVISNYFNFIVQKRRRPDENNPGESELVKSYEEFLLNTSISKVKVMCASLDHYGMPHNLLESVLLGEKIPEDEVNSYVEGLLEKRANSKLLSKKELKILRFILDKQKYKHRADVADLLKVQTIYQQIYSLISKYEFYQDSNSYNRLIYFIKSHNEYITADILEKLKSLNITFSCEFENMVGNLGDFNCLKEKKLFDSRKLQSSFERYICDNKKRPDSGTKLDIIYRKKLAGMSKMAIKAYLKIFERNHLEYTVEEKILLGIALRDEMVRYLNDLTKKVYEHGYKIDELDKRVLNKLKNSGRLGEFPELMRLLPDYHRQVTVEDRIVRGLDQQIISNPYEKIDFSAYSLNVSSKRLEKLEEKRMNILIRKFFHRILLAMNQNEFSLKTLLDDETKLTYEVFIEYKGMNQDNLDLLEEIRETDKYYQSMENDMQKEEFINNYIEFIRTHNGARPNYASEISEEVSLANKYDIMREYLTRADILLIEKTIKESENNSAQDFYNQYISFILDKGRMPCGNSDDPYEVKLNNLYLNLNKEFTREQNDEIRKLKKTYSKATIEATISFRKKKG